MAFGDSITDGARSTPDTHNSWPAILATRLAADKATAHMAIVNQGIGGNRVLSDGAGFAGVSALARFDRDVLSQPGVQWLMMLEGINDIGNSSTGGNGNSGPLTAEELIWGLRQVVDRAHQHGIKVIGCTILPYEGAAYFREAGEAIRQAVNTWIRTSGAYDAVVDFDAATRDPASSGAAASRVRSRRSPAPERRRLSCDGGGGGLEDLQSEGPRAGAEGQVTAVTNQAGDQEDLEFS